MFLCVRLVLDSLDSIYTPEDLRRMVTLLPSDLEDLYERIIGEICDPRNKIRHDKASAVFDGSHTPRDPSGCLNCYMDWFLYPQSQALIFEVFLSPKFLSFANLWWSNNLEVVSFVHFSDPVLVPISLTIRVCLIFIDSYNRRKALSRAWSMPIN